MCRERQQIISICGAIELLFYSCVILIYFFNCTHRRFKLQSRSSIDDRSTGDQFRHPTRLQAIPRAAKASVSKYCWRWPRWQIKKLAVTIHSPFVLVIEIFYASAHHSAHCDAPVSFNTNVRMHIHTDALTPPIHPHVIRMVQNLRSHQLKWLNYIIFKLITSDPNQQETSHMTSHLADCIFLILYEIHQPFCIYLYPPIFKPIFLQVFSCVLCMLLIVLLSRVDYGVLIQMLVVNHLASALEFNRVMKRLAGLDLVRNRFAAQLWGL